MVETKRQWPGHWEGDLIKGAFNRSCVGSLVERKTRFVVLCRMDGCTAEAALEGFTRQMKKLPAFLRESLTYDRGTEMTCHVELAKQLNLDIWFADPYAPWQRGSNENTNGLLRQFLPKGMDLSGITQMQLNEHRQTDEWAPASNTWLENPGRSHGYGTGCCRIGYGYARPGKSGTFAIVCASFWE